MWQLRFETVFYATSNQNGPDVSDLGFLIKIYEYIFLTTANCVLIQLLLDIKVWYTYFGPLYLFIILLTYTQYQILDANINML